MLHLAITFLLACGEPLAEAALVLDGPARVRVDQLGPVIGPKAVREDGTEPAVTWTVSDEGVARVVDGGVVAEAPGEARIVGRVGDETVVWTLVVDPALVLRVTGAPASVSVGDTLEFQALASIGETSVDAGAVMWTSSDPDVLAIDRDGAATAIGVGRVWVTARARGGASSMVELDVE